MQHRTALITTAAPASFVTLAEAKAQLRVTSSDDDTLIQAIVDAVCGDLDGADGKLKRAVGAQTLKLVLPHFTHRHWNIAPRHRQHQFNRINLPLPPVNAVSGITYFDVNNVSQTLDPSIYSLVNCGTEPSYIVLASGQSWPSTFHRDDAVNVTFTAGYATLPLPIKQGAILVIKKLYDLGSNSIFLTSDVVNGVSSQQYSLSPAAIAIIDDAVASLLFNFRIIRA